MVVFMDLHAHSTFSFHDGCNTPEDIAAYVAHLGRPAHAITDHANVSAHAPWEQAARAVGVQPLFGMEAYFIANVDEWRKKKERPPNTHLTILAENEVGYKNLLRITTESWRDGFYHRAHVSLPSLREHKEGLIVLSGCRSSQVSQRILDGELAAAEGIVRGFQDMLGAGNYFLETQLFDAPETRTVNEGVDRLARLTGVPMVVTSDVHMIDNSQDQQDNRKLLHRIRHGRKWEEPDDTFDYAFGYLMKQDEAEDLAVLAGVTEQWPNMLRNIAEIVERCDFTLPKSSFIEFPCDEGETAIQRLAKDVKVGLAERGVADDVEVVSRAVREMQTVREKGFADYFLVVADMVRWAKSNGILVGPARGSAAGSIVCWALRITEVNPLDYGLMFERFIDITRSDLPDIDIDFERERRLEVMGYLGEKYGKDRVGHLGTFTGWKAKNSLDAVKNVFNIPHADVEELKGLAGEADGLTDALAIFPKAQAIADKHPNVRKAELLAGGQMKGFSTHACGVLVSSLPMDDVCATYYTRGEGAGVCSVDYGSSLYLGLLKIDVLGLKTLSVIREVMSAVGMTDEEYYSIPVDDPEVMQHFGTQLMKGIFQFEGRACYDTASRFGFIRNILDLSHIISVARPGPLESGVERDLIRMRDEGTKRVWGNDKVDEILAYTHGLVVYQEQLLQLCRYVGNLPWEDCNAIRKSITSKRGTHEFERLEQAFLEGARGNGMEETLAQTLWNLLATFGGYAYNLSHGVSYSIISYHTMWFKTYHPTEFYAALCKFEDNDENLRLYLLEFSKAGGTVLPPHINKSRASWQPEGDMKIRAGFTSLKGIGDSAAAEIVRNQPYEDRAALAELRTDQFTQSGKPVKRKVANVRIMTALDEAGAFGDGSADFLGLGEFTRLVHNTERINMIGDITSDTDDEQIIAGRVVTMLERNYNDEAPAREARYGPSKYPPKHPQNPWFMDITIEDDTGSNKWQITRHNYIPDKIADVRRKKLKKRTDKINVGDIVTIKLEKAYRQTRLTIIGVSLQYRLLPDSSYEEVEGERL